MRINKRLVLGIAIPILFLGLGLFLVFAVFKTAKIYLMIAPENATITINGKKYKNGVHSLFPGKKTIKVTGDNIEGYETEVQIGMFETKRVAHYEKTRAQGTNESNYDSYIKNKSDYLVLKMLINEEENPDPDALALIERVEKAKVFLQVMPKQFNHPNEDGTVDKASLSDYTSNSKCPAAICVLLESKNPHKDDVKTIIEGKGYNYDDYYIVEKRTNG